MTHPHPRPQPLPRSSPRADGSWPRRLISPSGMVLVLLCLFLPFVGVSCETGLGTLRVQATGWDLAVNGKPSVSGSALSSGDLGDPPGASDWSDDQRVGAHPLMLFGILTILTGLVLATILRSARARALSGLTVAGVAAVLFATNEIVVLVGIEDQIEEQIGWAGDELSGGTRYGFWVTMIVLLAITGYHLIELFLARRPPSGAPPGHGPPRVPGPYPPSWLPGPPRPHYSSPPPSASTYPGLPPGPFGYPGGPPYGQPGPYGPG